MAEVQSNIRVNVDTTSAVASLRLLQNQISAFHTQMSKAGAAPAAVSSNMQQNLLNGINASGKFAASMVTVKSSTEAFTTALEKNKLSMGEYFRYAGGASKSFGKLFASEFATINQVAESRVKSLQSQYIKMGRDANGALQAIKVRPLSLDMNDLATRTALAAQKQQLLNQLLHQGSTNLLNFGKNTQWAGRQLMVGFSIPLLMVASAATKAYTQMETASLKLRRVYGDLNTTEAETRQITASITKLGHEFTKFGIAVSDTMDLASQIAAMGKTGNDLLQQVAETQRLVALGGVSTADAMQTTVALTNAFGVSTKDLATNVDFLNYAQNQTILSIQDVTEAIPKAGPVVKQLGGDVKDLTFFMTAMREGGISASQGANALKSGLASLINPSKAASDFLGTLGINITGIVNKDKGNLKQTVLDVATALDKLDPLNRARAIEKLFGKFQFSRMSALLQNVADPNSQAAQILNIANKSKAELSILSERELNRVANSPMNKFKKAQQELKTSLVPLGEQFMTAVIPLTKFLTTFIKGFNDLNKNSGGFFSNLTMWVAGIGPVVLMAIGLLANGVANIIKLFANVKSFINRTQTESRVLGETTHYMTKEQIDAKAAAVSLEQAHVNLAQAFSTERENLSLLVSEYQRAIAIQEAYAATNLIPRGPMGPMPKGYATGGVVQGPGGPTDDAVPTNLSNGEVVLSVATVKKNPGIVKALLGGKKIRIPNLSGGGQPGGVILPAGYAADIGNPNKNYASIPTNAAKMEAAGFGTQVQKVVNILAEFGVTTSTASGMFRNMNTAAKMGEAELNKWVAALEQNVQIAKTGTQLKAMQKTSTGVGVGDKQQESFAHVGGGTSYQSAITGQKVIAKSQLGMSGIPIDLNRQLAQGGANPKEFLKAYDTAGVQKWNDSVRAGGGNIEKLSGDISVFDARIKQLISTSGANKIFDSEAQAKAYGPGAISVQGAYNQARREQIGGGLTSALDVAHASPRDSREGGSKSKMFTADPARRAEASTHLAAAAKAELEVVGQNIGTESSKAVTSGVVKSVDKNSRSASPSKLGAELSGKNIVDGIMLPVKEAKPQADAAGKALGSAFIKPMVEASKQPLVKKSMPQFFGAGSTALTAANINRSNAVVSTPVPPTALQNAKANLAREGAWLKEEWAAIINPMKATLSAAKGQITSDAVFIEGNLKKAFSAVVPESSAMGQAFQQLKAIMTVARGNFLTEWEWIKEDFLGGTKAMKAGAVDIEAEMLRVGKAFNVTNRIAQFQVAMGDFGAILTKGSLSAVKAGIAQQAVAQQQGIWGSFTAKIKSIGSAISGIGARAVSATTGAISGAKSGVVGAANALGLRGNLESQLAAQMALAKTQKATIMQTVEKTRLMTEEDKQLVQLISAEQKLTEARIVELKTMLQAPTVFQQISNKLAEIGTIGQAGASKVNAAASQMFTFIGNKFTDLMNSGRPAAAALIEFQRAQKEAAVATRELEAAQRKGIATEEQRAIAANATARVDAARMGVNQTKTNIKGLGGISMGLMMAPMMLSQDKGAVGKFVNKNMMNIMMASMLIPMINPFINGVRSMATRMVLFANKSKLAEVAAAELAAGQKAAAGAQAAATGAVEAKTAAEEANTAATIAQTEVDATRVAEESALAVAEGAQVAEVTALDAAQGVLVGETVALDAATGVEVAEVVTLDGALALLEIPIIAVTAGLIGLVAIIAGGIWAFNAYNEEQNKQRKAGINMAKATAMTTDKLIALSKITKTVSATEAAARTRSDAYNAAVGVKDTSIGKKLLGSSFGKSTIADVKTMQANGMSQEEIGKNMASSLGTAVMEGVLTADQAKSFAAALGAEFKDLKLTTSITGSLDTLIGPGGANVVGPNAKPLDVAVQISKNAQDNFKNTMNQIVSTQYVTTDELGGTSAIQVTDTKKAAAATQYGIQSLQTNQQMIDSIKADKKSYDKNGNLTKDAQDHIDTIQSTNADTTGKLQGLAKGNADIFNSVIDSNIAAMKKAEPTLAKMYDDLNKSLTQMPQNDLKINLQVGLASGSLDPTIVKYMTDNQSNKTLTKTFNAAFKTAPGQTNALMQQLISRGAKPTTINAVLAMTDKGGKSTSGKMLKYLEWADKHGVKVNIATALKDPDKAFSKLTMYNKIPKKITKDIAVKLGYIEKGSDKYKNWDKVNGNKAITANVAINYMENNKQAFDDWMASGGDKASTATTTATISTSSTGGGGTTLLQDQQAIVAQNKATQAIIASGFGSGFAQMLAGADAKARGLYMTIKNGKAVLTSAGKKLQEAFDKQVVSSFVSKQAVAIRQFGEETKVRNLLNAKIKDKTLLSKMMADADFKAAMASALNIKNDKDRNKAIADLIAVEKKYLAGSAAAETAALSPSEKAQRENDVRSAYITQYQDAIASLKPQEDAINKAYDDRVAALEQVAELNKQIADSQKSQLDMADALSKGDISAAAKTAADIRAKAAVDALDKQKKALSDAKDAALRALTVTVNGEILTIDQLNARIASLEAQNAAVSRDIIDPAATKKAIDDNGGNNPVTYAPPVTTIVISPTPSTTTTTSYDSEFARKALIQLQSNGTAGLTAEQAKVLNIGMSATIAAGNTIGGWASTIAGGQSPTAGQSAKSSTPTVSSMNNTGMSNYTFLKSLGLSTGGIVPKYFAAGGFAMGTDTIPAMLTPGEFVIKKYAVDDFGVNNLKAINNGSYSENSDSNSVYNYNLSINVKSDSDPNQIAQTVMAQIKQIDAQRLRGNRI